MVKGVIEFKSGLNMAFLGFSKADVQGSMERWPIVQRLENSPYNLNDKITKGTGQVHLVVYFGETDELLLARINSEVDRVTRGTLNLVVRRSIIIDYPIHDGQRWGL